MNINRLGDFKVSGAIDTQFKTSLAVERIQRAIGKKVGGITAFLETLEMIGLILTMFLAVGIICGIFIFRIIHFLAYIYDSIVISKKPSL